MSFSKKKNNIVNAFKKKGKNNIKFLFNNNEYMRKRFLIYQISHSSKLNKDTNFIKRSFHPLTGNL